MYPRNNSGVAYTHFDAPIHACEQFKAASEKGNASATANVVRQYLIAGFADDAKEWADAHKPTSDPEGDVAQALAALHSARAAEEEKISRILANEFSHRTKLASFTGAVLSAVTTNVAREYNFPIAKLTISSEGNKLTGTGSTTSSGGKTTHRLTASHRSNVWRFKIVSKKEDDYMGFGISSFGLLTLSSDGSSGSVLEYNSDGTISAYGVTRASAPDIPVTITE